MLTEPNLVDTKCGALMMRDATLRAKHASGVKTTQPLNASKSKTPGFYGENAVGKAHAGNEAIIRKWRINYGDFL